MAEKEEKEAAKIMKKLTTIALEYDRLYNTLMNSSAGQRVFEIEPTLRRGNREKEEQIEALQQRLRDSNKERKETEAEVRALKKIINSMGEQLSRYTRGAPSRPLPSEASATFSITRKESIKLGSLIDAYDELVQEKLQSVREAAARLHEVRGELDKIAAENDRLRDTLCGMRDERDEIERLTHEKEESRAEVHKLKQFEGQAHDLQRLLQREQQKVEHRDGAIRAKECEIEELKTKLRTAETRLSVSYSPEQHKAAVDECKRGLDECRARLVEQQQEAAAAQDSLDEQRLRLGRAEQAVTALRSSLRDKEKLLRSRTKKLSKREAVVKAMGRKMNQLKVSCRTLSEERAEMLRDMTALTRSKADLQTAARRSKAQLGAANQRLETDHLVLTAQIAELTAAYGQARRSLRSCVRQCGVLREQARQKDRDIEELLRELRFLGLHDETDRQRD